MVEALCELVTNLPRFGQRLGSRFPQVFGQSRNGRLLLPQPGRISGHDRFQAEPKGIV